MRVGIGWDQHALVEGRPLILGGERFEFERGLKGHSDADVLVHAVCDAILGALGLGDLGRLSPDGDPAFAGADSLKLLEEVASRMRKQGYRVGNVDTIVQAQAPKLVQRLPAMGRNLAAALGCESQEVSVKAASPEGLGALGRVEGIAAQAVALLRREGADG
jgi:2-C-methyl-D-erythritol 2,4-cyclodiphosphate synthase